MRCGGFGNDANISTRYSHLPLHCLIFTTTIVTNRHESMHFSLSLSLFMYLRTVNNFGVFADPVMGACLCGSAAIKATSSQAAPLFSPPALARETLASMSVSARTQLLLFLISLLSIVGRSRFIEVRVLTIKSLRAAVEEGASNVLWCFQEGDDSDGLYSLLSKDQKRQSADFIFRRPLSKCSRLMVRSRVNFAHYAHYGFLHNYSA